MNSRPPAGLRENRITRSHFQQRELLESFPRRELGFYGRMLSEDLARLLPYGHGIDEGFKVDLVLSEPDGDSSDMIRDSMPSRYGANRSLEDGLRNFVEDSAGEILLGDVTWEVVFLRSAEGVHPSAFRMELVPEETLGQKRGKPIQYVMPGTPGALKSGRSVFISVEEATLVRIRLPQQWRRDVKTALRSLTAADRQQSLPSEVVIHPDLPVAAHFDFNEYQVSLNELLLKATHQLGWMGRGLYSTDVLEPYGLWRRLQFLRFQLAVRDAIMKGLSEALASAGRVLGFSVDALKLLGVVELAEIDSAQADLNSGARSLKEIGQLGVGG